MPDQPNNPAFDPAELESTPAPSTTPAPTQPAEKPVDWKAKYDGLKGYTQQLKGENDKLKIKVTDTTTEFETTSLTLSTQLTEQQTLAKQAQDALVVLQNQHKPVVSELTTIKTILGQAKYRPLVDWIGDGVLRTEGLEGDTLTAYLDNALTRINASGTQARQQFAAGATPPAPTNPSPATTPQTIQEVSQQMAVAMRTKGVQSEEYRSLRGIFDNLVKDNKHKPQ